MTNTVNPRYVVTSTYHAALKDDVYYVLDTRRNDIMRNFWFDGTQFNMFTNADQCADLCVKLNTAWKASVDYTVSNIMEMDATNDPYDRYGII